MVGSCGRAMESEVAAAGGPVDPAILAFADVQQLEYLPTKIGKFFGILHVDHDSGDRGEHRGLTHVLLDNRNATTDAERERSDAQAGGGLLPFVFVEVDLAGDVVDDGLGETSRDEISAG